MRTVRGMLRDVGIPILAGCVMLPAASVALAQSSEAQKQELVRPTAADHEASKEAKTVFLKAWAGNRTKEVADSKLVMRAASADAKAASTSGISRDGDDKTRYPGDLSYHGGEVVEAAESHAIYMLPNGVCPIAACWGNPEKFLSDLGKSEFIHVTDPYVKRSASDRYTLGQHAFVPFTPSATPFTDEDMQAVVHAVAAKSGQSGYGHIYHVFLPSGQDECIQPGICASNVFCAYHSSVDFKDIGHVLYSVEPYANVIGCQVRPGTPNGILVDSTNNVLSHELIETITDPDGTGWWNSTGLGNFGQEIGDECVFLVRPFYSDAVIINVQGRKYALQPEYDNGNHGCVSEDLR